MSNSEYAFEKLFNINVNDKTEKKDGLTYLSWAWAWAEFKKIYPNATYDIKKNEQGLPFFYAPMLGYICYTSVTVGDLTYEMWLPVMDGKNRAMKSEPYEYSTYKGKKTVDAATMFDINKTLMRCLTKNLAMFGLGLYIYAGEDLPKSEAEQPSVINKPSAEQLDKLKKLNVDILNVATYFKVKAEDLTAEQVDWAINRKTPKEEKTNG